MLCFRRCNLTKRMAANEFFANTVQLRCGKAQDVAPQPDKLKEGV